MNKILFSLIAALLLFGGLPLKAQAAKTVTLTFQDTSCTTATPCTAQIYKSAANCPADGTIGSLTWTPLATTLAGTATSTTTNWTFDDAQVTAKTTYCYYATATYTAGTDGPSAPSNTFQITITGPPNKGTLNGTQH